MKSGTIEKFTNDELIHLLIDELIDELINKLNIDLIDDIAEPDVISEEELREKLNEYNKKGIKKLCKKNKIKLSCKGKTFKKGELIDKLIELNIKLDLDSIKEFKLKKKGEKFKKKGEKSTQNNETLGMSTEVALCREVKIPYASHLDERCDEDTVKSLMPICKRIIEELKFKIVKHLGSNNGHIDFELADGKTLSVKTLKSDKNKLCPQKTGQPTRNSHDKIFAKFGLKLSELSDFSDDEKLDFIVFTNNSGKETKIHARHERERKKWMKDNIDVIFGVHFKNLVCCCDNIVIIIKTATGFEYFHSLKQDEMKFDKDKFSYVNCCLDHAIHETGKYKGKYYKGTEVLYDGIKLGEFQFHDTSRSEVKFRFYYKGLLDLLSCNKSK